MSRTRPAICLYNALLPAAFAFLHLAFANAESLALRLALVLRRDHCAGLMALIFAHLALAAGKVFQHIFERSGLLPPYR